MTTGSGTMASNMPIAKQLPGWLPPPGERPLLPVALAGLSASAGIVHASVVAEHFRQSVAFGLFFVLLAAFQLGWALATLMRPRRALYWAGAAVNAAVILVWTVSRTTALPIGLGSGAPEPIGDADVFATVVEVVVAGTALALLRPIGERVHRWLARGIVTVALVAAPLAGLVSAGPASGPAHQHGDHPHAPDDDHAHAVIEGTRAVDGESTHSSHALGHVVVGGASAIFGVYLVTRRLRLRTVPPATDSVRL